MVLKKDDFLLNLLSETFSSVGTSTETFTWNFCCLCCAYVCMCICVCLCALGNSGPHGYQAEAVPLEPYP